MYANLTNTPETAISEKDSIVIQLNLETIAGGRTLDTTGFTPTVINAGHVIIRETSTGNHKPMPLNGGATAYAALPAGHTYVGVLVASLLTTKPFAAIMVRGTVNIVASPFDPSSILSAFSTAVPLIRFTQD